MALRLALSKRRRLSLPIPSPPPSPAATPHLRRGAVNNHSAAAGGLPHFLTLSVGEKLRSLNSVEDRHRRPLPLPPESPELAVGAADVRRIMRCLQMERLRDRLRSISASTIAYSDFVRICGEVCGSRENGLECAKALDQSGNVIVLSGLVFLRPNQVTKSVERLISQSIAMPNDPRRKELNGLEAQKAQIDQKAETLVRRELYSGLGFLVLQTLGFMRLTFWELSWDVMEPICFFVTSLDFAMAYVYFMRTSTEPSFVGVFRRRFKAKQKKLMETHNFDIERYNELCQVFHPGRSLIESRDRLNEAFLDHIPSRA